MSQTGRIFYIHQKIKTNGKAVKKEIATELDVNPRTITRDLGYMKTQMDAPIKYSKSKKGYIYDQNYNLMDYPDEELLLFYLFVESSAKNMISIPIISTQFLEHLKRDLTKNYLALLGKIEHRVSAYQPFDVKDLKIILNSMSGKTMIYIEYISGKGSSSQRAFAPYAKIFPRSSVKFDTGIFIS